MGVAVGVGAGSGGWTGGFVDDGEVGVAKEGDERAGLERRRELEQTMIG